AVDQPCAVRARLENEGGAPLQGATLRLSPPEGWESPLQGSIQGALPAGRALEREFEVRPRGLAPGQRATLIVEATWKDGSGEQRLRAPVEVEAAPAVAVALWPSFAVDEFRRWCESQGIERL